MLTQFLEKTKKSFTCTGVATNRPIYNLHYYRARGVVPVCSFIETISVESFDSVP